MAAASAAVASRYFTPRWWQTLALNARGAVDAFAEQVGVTVVAGVFLDQVDVDPAEADVRVHEATGVGQGSGGAVLAGAGDLGLPGGEGVGQGGARG